MDGSSNDGCDSNEGVNLSSCCSKCLYEWIIFSGLFTGGGVGKIVMEVGEFYEFYDIWWGWHYGPRLSQGAPSTHNISGLSLAKHVHGRIGHVPWSSHLWTCDLLGSSVMVPCIDECVGSRVFIWLKCVRYLVYANTNTNEWLIWFLLLLFQRTFESSFAFNQKKTCIEPLHWASVTNEKKLGRWLWMVMVSPTLPDPSLKYRLAASEWCGRDAELFVRQYNLTNMLGGGIPSQMPMYIVSTYP